jgi:hypothetical protein
MLVNKKKILLSLILVAIMFIPAGLLKAGGSVQNDTLVNEEPLSGEVISNDDNVKIEKVDTGEMLEKLGDFDLPKVQPSEFKIDSAKLSTSFSPDMRMGNLNSNGQNVYGIKEFSPGTEEFMTRAVDDEDRPSDMINGSAITTPYESVSGSLTHSNVQANQDYIDWYQLEVTAGDLTPNTGFVKNISFDLTSYTGDDLVEFQTEDDGQGNQVLVTEFADALRVMVVYWDPYVGFMYMGGETFFYDNQNDNDGWVHDGDNGIYDDENWTFRFHNQIPATGTDDTDGFAGDFTEDGFIYIAMSLTYYIGPSAPATRSEFTADYTFEVTVPTANQPMDPASGDVEHAAGTVSGILRADSRFNQQDWYKIQGSDPTKLWNISYSINWTMANYAGMTTQYIYDPWLYMYFIVPTEGDDELWDTDDDGWFVVGLYHYTWYGIGSEANPGIWPDPQAANPFPVEFSPYLQKRDVDSPHREMYVGFISEPQLFLWDSGSGQLTGQLIPWWYNWMEYDFKVGIGEYDDNNPPEIKDVTITTKNPGGVELDPPTGGYYETEFTIEVTYMDEDNDEPTNIWLIIDPDTAYERVVNIKEPAEGGGPKDPFDTDYTDADPTPGRVYWLKILGGDLRDTPYPHQIRVNTTDFKPTGNIRLARTSAEFYLNDTLYIWNDEPVTINSGFSGVKPLFEDDQTTAVALENLAGDGMFDDPEDNFLGFDIWNGTEDDKEWMDNYDSDLLHIDIEEYEGVWSALITPKHNEHGTDSVKIRGYDEHSSVNMTVQILVDGVNDPPMVKYLLIDGAEVEVNNADPLRPVARLEDEDDVIEDHEFEFQIVAEDTDKEEDWGDLEYSYVRTQSDQWECDIDVGWDTGIVTFTPLNEDVNAGNSKMVFSVDDHGEEGDIRLELYFDVVNENDPPQIQIPSTVSPNYDQEDRITINPVATDEDKGDTLTYHVNMAEKIGTVDSVVSQLSSEADIQKGKNWDINEATGNFWFTIDDQNIWKTADGMADSVEITLVFEAVDAAGDSDSKQIILTLNDVNEPPEKPSQINYEIIDEDPDTDGDQGYTVTFSVDEVTDPDEDELTYRWEFGDGQTGTGITIDHTYANEGYKTVQMWVDDGEYPTEKISVMVNIVGVDTGADDTTPADDDDTINTGSDNGIPSWLIIVIVLAVVLVLIVLILAFVAFRKKPAPAAQQMYPGYDQAMLQGYQAQGLPPGQAEQLPPMDTPGLPPAQEGYPPETLPPAEPGMAPEAQPEAPAAQPEAPAAQPEMAEAPPAAGMGCPSCGSPVDPSWFLCPNCKAPLQ